MNIDSKLDELGERLERSAAAQLHGEQRASRSGVIYARSGVLSRPRLLAGGSLGLAGIGTALVLALSAGGAAAPPAFAITHASDGTILVHFNTSGGRTLIDVDEVLVPRYHETINVSVAPGPATVKGPIACTPLPDTAAPGDPVPTGPRIKVELGDHGTDTGSIPSADNTGVPSVVHLTDCDAKVAYSIPRSGSGNTGS